MNQPAEVWLITGIPGAGKTTTAGLLALRFSRGVHIEADRLQEWIVSGGVLPGDAPEEENARQLDLVTRNACLLARSYAEAGFKQHAQRTGVTIAERWAHLEDVMRAELNGVGLWVKSANATAEDAVNAILARRVKALLRPAS